MIVSVGLDVGGAHLKAARVQDGRVHGVEMIGCPLWKGLDQLHTALAQIQEMCVPATAIGVTMTGELSDVFADRPTGVATLVDALTSDLPSTPWFWMGPLGFAGGDAAKQRPTDTGSTNFLAAAAFAASQVNDGVLIDFGSTTTDIIALTDGKPNVEGLTDSDRLASGELVYTGMTRTPVMGVATRAPFKGRWQSLAREVLATMGDVRRILSELPKGLDLHATADGRSQSLEDSIARFARMFGLDAQDGSLEDWRSSAAYIREEQVRSIQDELLRVLSRHRLPLAAPIIAAGIGSDTARILAQRVGRPMLDFGRIAHANKRVIRAATRSAPAVAIAHLVSAHGSASEVVG